MAETAPILDFNPQTVRTRFMRARRLQAELKLTFGKNTAFDGARDRLVARVLERLAATPSAGTSGPGR